MTDSSPDPQLWNLDANRLSNNNDYLDYIPDNQRAYKLHFEAYLGAVLL